MNGHHLLIDPRILGGDHAIIFDKFLLGNGFLFLSLSLFVEYSLLPDLQ